ncbi:MAG: response regulator transcription factor [Sandaracinaceae bacterium]|nr:response regulator transcription factor [Sandaracinaceae bacterium]MDW8245625.1 response regulator transcription factor [Sandaracinaceae bacterium]
MADRRRILIVEDDPALAMGLVDALEFEGFSVIHAKTGQEGLHHAFKSRPDAIILDLMLPDTNGYLVCERIRSQNPLVPIIMLTARGQESDKIRGLDAGADDYITKPFSIGELIARMRAIFRRVERGNKSETPFQIGQAVIDPTSQTVTIGRRKLPLSFYETQVLKYLHERAGQAVSRDEILERVWGITSSTHNRTVDNCIVKLRKKIEPRSEKPKHILTVYGIGYKLVP